MAQRKDSKPAEHADKFLKMSDEKRIKVLLEEFAQKKDDVSTLTLLLTLLNPLHLISLFYHVSLPYSTLFFPSPNIILFFLKKKLNL